MAKKRKSTYVKVPKKDKLPTSRTPEVMEEHQCILMEYFTNGFNGGAAVIKYRPHLTNHTASVVFGAIKNSAHNKEYVEELQARLSSMVDVKAEHITKELIQWGYSDITQFIGLSETEIKELPPEIRRTIQSYEVINHVDKHGNDAGQTVKVKLINKLDSLKELAKHIGYYSIDNDQKANRVNILNILKDSSPDTLNALLKTIEANTIENE